MAQKSLKQSVKPIAWGSFFIYELIANRLSITLH